MHSVIDQKFPNYAQITGEAEGLTINGYVSVIIFIG